MSVEVLNARNCKELPLLEGLMEEDLGASFFFPSNAFMASARSFNTLYGIAKAVISN